jgi:hypothetical protein
MATTERSLLELLNRAKQRELVLPNFQRSFVWKLSDVRELLVSFLLDYPVGSFLTVEAKSDLFDERGLLEGDAKGKGGEARNVVYLLDGQQRLSSCRLIFGDVWNSGEVPDSIRRRWFLNLNLLGLEALQPLGLDDLVTALEPGSEAVQFRKVSLATRSGRALPADCRPTQDPLFRTWCVENALYPLSPEVLEQNIDVDLIGRIADHWRHGQEKYQWLNWIVKLIGRLEKVRIPTLEIPTGPDTLEKVARIFETVNKTGARLGLFDLVVARAAKCINLRDAIKEEIAGYQPEASGSQNYWPVDAIYGDESSSPFAVFLAEIPKVIAALAQIADVHGDDGVRLDLSKRAILKTRPEEIERHARAGIQQLIRAFHFTQTYCGTPWQISECPYQQMLLPLSMCLTTEVWKDPAACARLQAWYWSAIFSGRYTSAQDTKSRHDAIQLRGYVAGGGAKPAEVTEIADRFVGYETLLDATEPGDGLFRGVLQFVISHRPLDLLADGTSLHAERPFTAEAHGSKGKVRDVQWENHHIVPKNWVKQNESGDAAAKSVNSCLNRAWVSRRSNRGGDGAGAFDQGPHQYLAALPPKVLGDQSIPFEATQHGKNQLERLLAKRYDMLKSRIIKRISALS